MKKTIIGLIVFFILFLLIGNVYSKELNNCIGPYDGKTIVKNYKMVVNDYYNSVNGETYPTMCTDSKNQMYLESAIMELCFRLWEMNTFTNSKIFPDEKKQSFRNKTIKVELAVLEFTEKLKSKDINRYNALINRIPIIKEYYTSHEGYKKLQKTVDDIIRRSP